MCRELALSITARNGHCGSHWLTPPGHPKRFDTRFFMIRVPQGQQAVPRKMPRRATRAGGDLRNVRPDERAYADTPASLHGLPRHSRLAHLLRLHCEERAVLKAKRWRLV